MLKVFKFGGASIKNADALRNLVFILQQYQDTPLVVVLSAMGKSTNALEALLHAARNNEQTLYNLLFNDFEHYHRQLVQDVFAKEEGELANQLDQLFSGLNRQMKTLCDQPYDFHYDQTICYGELISTAIVHAYLNKCGLDCRLLDARTCIKTDGHYRAANVNWPATEKHIRSLKPEKGIVLSQGFIGSDEAGHTTTLGREGSDYTAAIFAYCLDGEEVVIWKDVPGLLNADPKRFDKAVQLSAISYGEAIELAYYGASVIHPKTIKPLENKGIPLMVQSFSDLSVQPSLISHRADFDSRTPSFIVKDNQMLCSVSPRDFSFMNEHSLHKLFGMLAGLDVHANLIQVSAISLSFCADYEESKLNALLLVLQESYRMKYNTGLELLTIRHYNDQVLTEMCQGRHILLEQRSRTTAQMVLKTKAS